MYCIHIKMWIAILYSVSIPVLLLNWNGMSFGSEWSESLNESFTIRAGTCIKKVNKGVSFGLLRHFLGLAAHRLFCKRWNAFVQALSISTMNESKRCQESCAEPEEPSVWKERRGNWELCLSSWQLAILLNSWGRSDDISRAERTVFYTWVCCAFKPSSQLLSFEFKLYLAFIKLYVALSLSCAIPKLELNLISQTGVVCDMRNMKYF